MYLVFVTASYDSNPVGDSLSQVETSHLYWVLPRVFALYYVIAAYAKSDDGSLITLRCSGAIIRILFSLPLCLPPSPVVYMSAFPLPQWHSPTQPFHGRISRRRNGFSHFFNSIPGIGISLGSFILVDLIFCMTFLSRHGPSLLSSSKWTIPTNHDPSSLSDDLSLEQIRDIVAPTRGFFSRDYSLYLGWNNVSICGNLIRAELMFPNRCNIFSTQPSYKQICLIAPWSFLHLFMHAHASIICKCFFVSHLLWPHHNPSSRAAKFAQTTQ